MSLELDQHRVALPLMNWLQANVDDFPSASTIFFTTKISILMSISFQKRPLLLPSFLPDSQGFAVCIHPWLMLPAQHQHIQCSVEETPQQISTDKVRGQSLGTQYDTGHPVPLPPAQDVREVGSVPSISERLQ